ncbi:MAG: nucleotidyltransferase domain-containing protein [Bacteroidetes bacterium]|nr:nucleotidyltransferase domain-containing protein [Bacteroidota bacterium]
MNSLLTEVKATLHQLKPQLSQKYAVDTLGLFGSIVRDDFTENSDIDIIVTFNRPVGIEFIDLANELEEKLKRKVDLVSRGGVKPKYLEVIDPQIIYV